MPQLVDFNQIVIAAAAIAQKNFGRDTTNTHVKGLFINSLIEFNKKFRNNYGDMIMCCDGRNSWRRDEFPYYKVTREKGRADSPLDWDQIHECMEELYQELLEFFPYKVIRYEKAEGDDVIAVLCNYLASHEHTKKGLYTQAQPVVIISDDKDFKQLQIYPNVTQYSPRFDYMIVENNPKEFLVEHIIRGDRSDGIPNFKMPDDFFSVGEGRQTPIRKNKLADWVLCESPKDFCESDDELAGYRRNQKLIDLVNGIPDFVKDAVLEQYHEAPTGDRRDILKYCVKYGFGNHIQDIQYL